MHRILIAGCGDVGNALGRRLVNRSDQVWGLRRNTSALAPGITAVKADLSNAESLVALPQHLDAVVYAAAAESYAESSYRQTYVDGLSNMLGVLEREGQGPRFIFVSSTSVYGQNLGEWVDEASDTRPRGFSGQLMLEGESLLQAYRGVAIAVRFGGIYGPGRNRLIEMVRSGAECQEEPPSYTNRIHRDDCAGVLVHLLGLESPESVYLGVDSHPAKQCEVMCWLSERMGVPAPSKRRLLGGGGGKRCSNRRLLRSGYRLEYPSYRDGYAAVLNGQI